MDRPALGMFAARFQWQGAESAIHGSFVRDEAAGPGVRKGSAVDPTGGEPGYRVRAGGAHEPPRVMSSMVKTPTNPIRCVKTFPSFSRVTLSGCFSFGYFSC